MECTVVRNEMLDVLYGEADAATARRVEEHQVVCAACRDELQALRAVRRELAAWRAPERRPPLALRSTGRHPQMALAAAAAVVLGLVGAFALGRADVRYEQGALAFRLGAAASPDAAVGPLLAEQEARHRAEIGSLRAELRRVADGEREGSGAAGADQRDEAVLRRVADMIARSEARQQEQWQASLAEFGERADAQRRYDLARVSAGLSYLDGKTGQQVARTTELMGYVLQAAQKK